VCISASNIKGRKDYSTRLKMFENRMVKEILGLRAMKSEKDAEGDS
jgi:hypothetical protein